MDTNGLLARAREYHARGNRLALINATSILPTDELPEGAFDLCWSFACDGQLEHIRERVLPSEEVPSISTIFGGDLQGQLYTTAERVPFSPGAIRRRLEAGKPPPKTAAVAAPAVAPANGTGAGA